MINRLLLFGTVAALSSATVLAQIPNGGFETWNTVGTYQDPAQWITFNSVTSLAGALPSCSQGTPGSVGNYYATVTTRNTSFGLLSGIISAGNATSGTSGFPYASRPAALTGQWQYGIQASDSGFVAVYFTKWNPVTQTSDSVGGGAVEVLGTLSGWHALNVPITYFNSDTPDTAFVIVASSLNSPVEGSFIKIDDLGFGGSSAGIGELESAAALQVFPSPATDRLNVTAVQPMTGLDVMDMTGRTILRQGANSGAAMLNVADMRSGRYLVQVQLADGKRIVRSFIKR